MLFYPSHDIALANGVKHFNPPAAALRLQEDLASLAEIWNHDPTQPQPWGWDWDTRQYIHKHLGVKLSELPSDDDLQLIRQLSSRAQTIPLLKAIGYQGELPRCISSEDELSLFLNSMNDLKKYVLKSPWSSSGRGLICTDQGTIDNVFKRSSSVIKKMGCIVAEPWLENKEKDFAMLFHVGRDEVRFLGYSLFENDDNGTYRFGYLLSNAEMERRLARPSLIEIRQKLLSYLTALFAPLMGHSWQLGYVGIDMMTLDSELTPVMPCIEMNLRATMGTVCRLYFDVHMQEGQEGRFTISPLMPDGHFHYNFDIY